MKIDLRLLQLLTNRRWLLIITILTGLFGGVVVVIQARVLSQIVNLSFLEGMGLVDLSQWLYALLGLILARTGLVWVSEAAGGELALRVKTALREQVYAHIQSLGPSFLRSEESGELNNLLQDGIEALDAYFSQYLPQIALAALIPITYLFFVFPLDWLSGLILLITAPLIPVFMILIGNLAQSLTQRQWTALSRMSAYFLDVLQGLTTLKILGRSRAQVKVLAEVSERFRLVTMGVLKVTFLSALALELISTLSTAVVAVQVGLRLLYGWLEFEQALFVLLLAPEFYLPLRTLGARFHAGMSGVTAAERIFEVLAQDAPNSVPEKGVNQDGLGRLSGHPEIRFKHISLEYEDRLVLDQVTFSIPPRQVTALVGQSGAGKSSLVDLLLGFLQPSSGSIFLDEQLLSRQVLEDWRTTIAWVPQQPYLYHDSVINNIRLSKPQASLDEVVQAAILAHADEFIQALPQGYETQIGEGGTRLSGGQAQRLALARAFLRDAPVLILDEPTAHLDSLTERQVQESLQRLFSGRTVLVIAHRLSTVFAADQILVLEQGKIAEQGTHADLLAQNGLYARLLQADQFVSPQTRPEKMPVKTEQPGLFFPKKQGDIQLAWDGKNPALLLSTLQRLLSFLQPYMKWVAFSILSGFATIASSIGLMTASAYIISYAALSPSIAELQVAIVGVRFFGITRGLFRYLERYLSHQVTFRLLARLRVWFYQALEPLAPARLMNFRSGDLLARITGDIETLENFYVRVISPPIVALLVAILAFSILVSFDLVMGWILVAFLLLGGIGLPLLMWLLGRKPGAEIIQRKASLSVAILDGLQGMPDLVAHNQQAQQAAVVSQQNQLLIRAQRRFTRISALQTALAGFISHAGMWMVLVYAIPLVEAGNMSGIYLAVVVLAALTSFEAVAPLPMAAQYLGSNLQAAQRLMEVVDVPAEVSEYSEPVAPPQSAFSNHSSATLQVKALHFNYPLFSGSANQKPQEVSSYEKLSQGTRLEGNIHNDFAFPGLQDINFDLEPGRRIGIVGPSGAGKTTLLNLLLRFWDFKAGQILLGGVDIRLMSAEAVRSQMAVISQSTYLFSASLMDNLRIANPQANQNEIDLVIEQAGLMEFVQQLPQGYETWIGEHGLRLSGGERQRLAIARALLKKAPILILDEATANLDSITEKRIMDTILSTTQTCSLLMITHRLAFMKAMDEILVMDRGRVVEHGQHASLIAAAGLYKRMWDIQHGWLIQDMKS